MSELKIGEVILNNDIPMVILDCINREDISSMSYDRSYKLCSVEELGKVQILSNEDFDKLGYWVEVKGIKFPDIKRVTDIAPFEIKPIKSYSIRQKSVKTVIVYE